MSGKIAKLNRALLVALCKNAETANTIADRIEELERENAALRQDKERLDWLDAVLMSVGEMGQPQMDGTRFSGQCRMNGRYRRVAGRSLRDFADAARTKEGGAS